MLIKAKKDLFNAGQCFTKGQTYELGQYERVSTNSGLMEKIVINDQGERHIIGQWWREFSIIPNKY